MSKLKVVFSDKQKNVKLPTGTRMLLRRASSAVFIYEKFPGDAEVNVNFVNDEEIKVKCLVNKTLEKNNLALIALKID